ncbi:MAG: DegT/DnrJ/EryC1/StrS family aminotransferase, partial [Pseudomonadota bacterium]
VDLFGLPADYPALGRLAEANDLLLIADAAQSFGGRLNGAEVGTLAPITATSFYPGKALGCYGDGGAVFCMDTDDEAVLRSVLFHGTDESRGESIRIGLNGRLDTMQAAVLLEKAAIFDDELNVRRRIARIYEDRLGAFADLQTAADGFESSCGYFSLCVDDRDGVCGRLKAAGVPTAVYYRKPLHKMAAFAEFGPSSGLPVCEELSERILSLPIHAYLTDAQAHRICDAVEAAIGR